MAHHSSTLSSIQPQIMKQDFMFPRGPYCRIFIYKYDKIRGGQPKVSLILVKLGFVLRSSKTKSLRFFRYLVVKETAKIKFLLIC